MAGRPPPAPNVASAGFGQGWTTTAPKSTTWRRAQSASSLRSNKSRLLDSGSDNGAGQPPATATGYQSERLRGAGVEVLNTPPRKPSHETPERSNSSDKECDRDVHADCRARMFTLSTEVAEASQSLKNLQREHEKLLRQMGSDREELRSLQKLHSERDQEASTASAKLRKQSDEISFLRNEQEQQQMRTKRWEDMEHAVIKQLEASLQASEERESNLQGSLTAEKLSQREASGKLQNALRYHEDCERTALEKLAATKEKELRFTELQDQVAGLTAKCVSRETSLNEKTSEFDALREEWAESNSCTKALRRELSGYQDGLAGELDAALSKLRASEQEAMDNKVAELCAERDEARRQAALMQKEEEAAKVSAKSIQKRLSASEVAQSESRATAEMREKEMQELQAKSAKTTSKKEAEVKMLQSHLEQAKTEIAEMYDALVRASESQPKASAQRKSVKH